MTSAALDGQMRWSHPDPERDAAIKADLAHTRARKAADPTIHRTYAQHLIDHARHRLAITPDGPYYDTTPV